MDIYYVDGQFIEEDKAVISVKDISVLRGFGVFDFLITYNKRLFRLEQHVERLQNSARYIGLDINLSTEEICAITEETVKRNIHHDESNIRLVYTGGVAADGVTPEGNGKLMVMVTPKHQLPEWWYTDGVKLITVDFQRIFPLSKSTNYLTAVYALGLAKEQNAVEAIHVSPDNLLQEGTTTNIFLIQGNRLMTPEKNILPGVTRSAILELAVDHFDVEVCDINKNELAAADEVFITASNKEVVPVVTIDGLTIGDGKPGPKTLQMMQVWRDHTTAYGQGEI